MKKSGKRKSRLRQSEKMWKEEDQIEKEWKEEEEIEKSRRRNAVNDMKCWKYK